MNFIITYTRDNKLKVLRIKEKNIREAAIRAYSILKVANCEIIKIEKDYT